MAELPNVLIAIWPYASKNADANFWNSRIGLQQFLFDELRERLPKAVCESPLNWNDCWYPFCYALPFCKLQLHSDVHDLIEPLWNVVLTALRDESIGLNCELVEPDFERVKEIVRLLTACSMFSGQHVSDSNDIKQKPEKRQFQRDVDQLLFRCYFDDEDGLSCCYDSDHLAVAASSADQRQQYCLQLADRIRQLNGFRFFDVHLVRRVVVLLCAVVRLMRNCGRGDVPMKLLNECELRIFWLPNDKYYGLEVSDQLSPFHLYIPLCVFQLSMEGKWFLEDSDYAELCNSPRLKFAYDLMIRLTGMIVHLCESNEFTESRRRLFYFYILIRFRVCCRLLDVLVDHCYSVVDATNLKQMFPDILAVLCKFCDSEFVELTIKFGGYDLRQLEQDNHNQLAQYYCSMAHYLSLLVSVVRKMAFLCRHCVSCRKDRHTACWEAVKGVVHHDAVAPLVTFSTSCVLTSLETTLLNLMTCPLPSVVHIALLKQFVAFKSCCCRPVDSYFRYLLTSLPLCHSADQKVLLQSMQEKLCHYKSAQCSCCSGRGANNKVYHVETFYEHLKNAYNQCNFKIHLLRILSRYAPLLEEEMMDKIFIDFSMPAMFGGDQQSLPIRLAFIRLTAVCLSPRTARLLEDKMEILFNILLEADLENVMLKLLKRLTLVSASGSRTEQYIAYRFVSLLRIVDRDISSLIRDSAVYVLAAVSHLSVMGVIFLTKPINPNSYTQNVAIRDLAATVLLSILRHMISYCNRFTYAQFGKLGDLFERLLHFVVVIHVRMHASKQYDAFQKDLYHCVNRHMHRGHQSNVIRAFKLFLKISIPSKQLTESTNMNIYGNSTDEALSANIRRSAEQIWHCLFRLTLEMVPVILRHSADVCEFFIALQQYRREPFESQLISNCSACADQLLRLHSSLSDMTCLTVVDELIFDTYLHNKDIRGIRDCARQSSISAEAMHAFMATLRRYDRTKRGYPSRVYLLNTGNANCASSQTTCHVHCAHLKSSNAQVLIELGKDAAADIRRGLSISLWVMVKLEHKSHTVHLMSIGNDDVQCCLNIVFPGPKLSLSFKIGGVSIDSRKCPGTLPKGQLICITLYVKYIDEELAVKLHIDGRRLFKTNMKWNFDRKTCSNETTVLLFGRSPSSVSIGSSVCFFAGDLSDEAVLYLCKAGPNMTFISPAKVNSSAYFYHDPTEMERQKRVYEQLAQRLLDVYCISTPDTLCVYENGEKCRPKNRQCYVACSVSPWVQKVHYDPIRTMLESYGGIMVHMFIIARIAELDATDDAALRCAFGLLLTALRFNEDWLADFQTMKGCKMLSYLLCQNPVEMTDFVIEELLGICLRPAVQTYYDEEDDSTQNSPPSAAATKAVFLPELILEFLTNMRLWAKHGWPLFDTLLNGLCSSADLPYSRLLEEFNFAERFFDSLLDTDFDEEMQAEVANTLKRILLELIGSPPCVLQISRVFDYLVLSHPASCMSVNYRTKSELCWLNTATMSKIVDDFSSFKNYPASELFTDEFNYISSIHLLDMAVEPTSGGHGHRISEASPVDCSSSRLFEQRHSVSGQNLNQHNALRLAMLELLNYVIPELPESSFHEIAQFTINWELVIAMLHHQEDERIRIRLVELICILLRDSSEAFRANFMATNGFHLLQNELEQHPCCAAVFSSILSLLVKDTSAKVETCFLADTSREDFVAAVLHLLIRLLKNICSDIVLLSNLTTLLINALDMERVVLLQADTADALASLLVAICKNVQWENDAELTVKGSQFWQRLCWALIRNFSTWSDENGFMAVVRLMKLIMYSELQYYLSGEMSIHLAIRWEFIIITEELLKQFRQLQSGLEQRRRSSGGEQHADGGMKNLSPDQNVEKRLTVLLELIGNFFLFMPCSSDWEEQEAELLNVYFSYLRDLVPEEALLFKRTAGVGLVAENALILLKRLFNYVLHPASLIVGRVFSDHYCKLSDGQKPVASCGCRRRFVIINSLYRHAKTRAIIKNFLHASPSLRGPLLQSFHDFYMCKRLSEQQTNLLTACLKFDFFVEPLDGRDVDAVQKEHSLVFKFYELFWKWLFVVQEECKHWASDAGHQATAISEMAMSVTCSVVAKQQALRKSFLARRKREHRDVLSAVEFWKIVKSSVCHPESLFHTAADWPNCWSMDPTLGPDLVPVKLRHIPVPLNVDHLLYKDENVAFKEMPSLNSLIASPPFDFRHEALMDERVVFSCSATVISLFYESVGDLLLGRCKLQFMAQESRTVQKRLPVDEQSSFLSWDLDQLTQLNNVSRLGLDAALEFRFVTNETLLVDFGSPSNRQDFLNRLRSSGAYSATNCTDGMLSAATTAWQKGKITNFQYLIMLNEHASRSFSDIIQYPVFPYVLADYNSVILNLNDPNSYRKFHLPIAVQRENSKAHFIDHYNSLQQECSNKSDDSRSPLLKPYHYGSLYSNSGVVLYYLLRLRPFTDLALEYHDGNFDLPDRLFHNVSTTWRLVSGESRTDCKELVPEFFCVPEFLQNLTGLNLGVRQSGEVVSDVILPNWCPRNDPRLFTLIHRQALESDIVSKQLHKWIDLIYGFRQLGQAAVDAVNVYNPYTSVTAIRGSAGSHQDEILNSAFKAMLKTCGRLPKQLFKTPHPSRSVIGCRQSVCNGPLPSIDGLRWGHFAGSPDLPEAALSFQKRLQSHLRASHALPLPAGCLRLFPAGVAALLELKRDLTLPAELPVVTNLCWIAFGFADRIVRLRTMNAKETGWIDLFPALSFEVTAFPVWAEYPIFCVGTDVGTVLVLSFCFVAGKFVSFNIVRKLYGHTSAVSVVQQSMEFKMIISGSQYGELFAWDMNRLIFVRSLTKHAGPISLCAVSCTTGDIVSVASKEVGSDILLHTVNGRLVGLIESDISVCSLALSSATEGLSINCLAAGLQNGVIRLWDMWTLSPVADIYDDGYLEPIISLCFTPDNNLLFAVTDQSNLLCWSSSQIGADKNRPIVCYGDPLRDVFMNDSEQ